MIAEICLGIKRIFMAFQSKYKSRWTGPQIDDSIGKVQTSSATPTPGGIAIYDSNGNLKTSKPVADNDTVRLQDVANPNLLVNGDFRINQRGLPSYSNQYDYTVDRWQLRQNGITLTPISGGGISVVKNSANVNIWQILEMSLATLAGKTITISGKCDGVVFTATGTVPSAKTTSTQKVCEVHATNNWLSFNVSKTTDTNYDMYFEIAAQGNFSYEWVKLELGEVATNFCPRPYSEELAICQMPFDNQGISTTYSNPNLLINGDFQVNQRNFATGTSGYTVDMWILGSNGYCTATLNQGNTITLTNNTADQDTAYFIQKVSNTNKLIGKTLTMSFCDGDDIVHSATGTIGSGAGQNYISMTIGPNSNLIGWFRLYMTGSNILEATFHLRRSKTLVVKWAKLEVGSVATAFSPKPYEEELAACQMPHDNSGISTTYSNPNLLINGDFRVNQRGFTTDNSTNKYTVDRWYKSYGPAMKIELNTDKTITATYLTSGSGTASALQQTIEDVEVLKGKSVTASVNVSSLTGSSWALVVSSRDGSSQLQYTQTNITSTGLVTATLNNISSSTVYLRFAIVIYRPNASVNDSITFNECKLEVGEIATPFSPRPYAEELALCQRYYQTALYEMSLFAQSTTAAYGHINLPVTLRTTPTVVFPTGYIHGNNSYLGNPSNIGVTGTIKDNCVRFYVNNNYTQNGLYMLESTNIITFDAEIY